MLTIIVPLINYLLTGLTCPQWESGCPHFYAWTVPKSLDVFISLYCPINPVNKWTLQSCKRRQFVSKVNPSKHYTLIIMLFLTIDDLNSLANKSNLTDHVTITARLQQMHFQHHGIFMCSNTLGLVTLAVHDGFLCFLV